MSSLKMTQVFKITWPETNFIVLEERTANDKNMKMNININELMHKNTTNK